MPREKSSDARDAGYPEFKSRDEELAWHEANKERLITMVARYGKMAPARIIEVTKPLTIRIPIADIERARRIADKQGVGYQTVLKKAIRDGLKQAGGLCLRRIKPTSNLS